MTIGFPWAGAALLLVLLVLAVVAHGFGRARRAGAAAAGTGARPPAWLARFTGSGGNATSGDGLSVKSTVQLDANTQLHIVCWQRQQWLVASSSQGGATLIDRLPTNGVAPPEGT